MEVMEQGDEQGYDHNPMLNDYIAIHILHLYHTSTLYNWYKQCTLYTKATTINSVIFTSSYCSYFKVSLQLGCMTSQLFSDTSPL